MKTHITTIIAISAFLPLLPIKAEEVEKLSAANPPIAEVQQLKEEIRRQEVMLQALKDRLSVVDSKNQKKETLVIALVAGQPVLMGAGVSLNEIELALKQRAEISTSYPIVIRADKNTPYSSVVEILELSKKAGLSNIAFATTKE